VPVTVQQSSWNAKLGRHIPELDVSLSNISTASHQFQRQHVSAALRSKVLMHLLPKSLGYAAPTSNRSRHVRRAT